MTIIIQRELLSWALYRLLWSLYTPHNYNNCHFRVVSTNYAGEHEESYNYNNSYNNERKGDLRCCDVIAYAQWLSICDAVKSVKRGILHGVTPTIMPKYSHSRPALYKIDGGCSTWSKIAHSSIIMYRTRLVWHFSQSEHNQRVSREFW
jgi:hypothetical protein